MRTKETRIPRMKVTSPLKMRMKEMVKTTMEIVEVILLKKTKSRIGKQSRSLPLRAPLILMNRRAKIGTNLKRRLFEVSLSHHNCL